MLSAPTAPIVTTSTGSRDARWRSLLSNLALAGAVLGLLWLMRLLVTPPAGARVVRAEMASLGPDDLTRPNIEYEASWQALDAQRLATWTGPYLLRYRLSFTARDTTEPHAIAVSVRAAFRATWDGVPLPANGQVGATPREERPGRVDWMVPVPARQGGVGEHVLLLRASSHAQRTRFASAEAVVRVAPLSALAVHTYRAWLILMVALGALLTAAGYALRVIARADGQPAARVLLALGASGTLLAAAEAWRPLVGYTYPWHATRLRLVLLFTALTMSFLARYMQQRVTSGVQPEGPRWPDRLVRWMPAGFLLIGLVVASYDMAAWGMHLLGISGTLLVLVAHRPVPRDLHPLVTLLGAALVALLVAPFAWLDGSYLIVLAALMVAVLLGHASHLRARAWQAHVLESTQHRLTAALMRRSIQPHWLMNTLTGVQELIEQDPPRASRTVELLAEEFRLFLEASRHAWIAGERELALCRTHLAIVSQAVAHPRTLEVFGERLLAEVALPPGVLHALLENGLTHGGVEAPAQIPDFRLQCDAQGDVLALTLDAPGGRARRVMGTRQTGTGTQFVEMSLEAAFPGGWTFTQEPVGAHWRATLHVPLAAARAARRALEEAA